MVCLLLKDILALLTVFKETPNKNSEVKSYLTRKKVLSSNFLRKNKTNQLRDSLFHWLVS